jgi:hypothetical protein
MLARIITARRLEDHDEVRQNLAYWLSRPPEERLRAVEDLRIAYYGPIPRLQRVARVVEQARR